MHSEHPWHLYDAPRDQATSIVCKPVRNMHVSYFHKGTCESVAQVGKHVEQESIPKPCSDPEGRVPQSLLLLDLEE